MSELEIVAADEGAGSLHTSANLALERDVARLNVRLRCAVMCLIWSDLSWREPLQVWLHANLVGVREYVKTLSYTLDEDGCARTGTVCRRWWYRGL
jgi:hypothetical protein